MHLTPSTPSTPGPADRFTGAVFATMITSPADPARLAAGMVRFTPGARTNWHVHDLGQTLHVLDGVALVGTRDGAVIRAGAGETVHCLPNEEHWHGATPDTAMTHLAMVVAPPGSPGTTWLEPVTDAQYGAANNKSNT